MMLKMPVFIYNSIYFGPALGELGCQIYGFFGGLTGTVSICTLAAISLDRYYVIKFPLSRRFTSLRAKICVISAWTYGAVFSLIPLLPVGLGSYVPEGYLTSCSFDYLTPSPNIKTFILTFFFAAWVVPFILISFCYTNIIKVVVQSKNISKKDPIGKESSRHIKEEEKRRQELRLAVVVLFVVGLWFVAWTPYATVALLGISGRAYLISPLSSMIPALFCKAASCIDPFVYAVTHPKFKAEFRAFFCNEPLERKNTMKAWTTQTMNESKKPSIKQQEFASESCSSEDVIEEVVMVNIKNDLNRRVPSRKSSYSRSTVQPSEPEAVIVSDKDLKKRDSLYRPSWWFRPSFSNRSSSIRSLARTWTARERHIVNTFEIENPETKSF